MTARRAGFNYCGGNGDDAPLGIAACSTRPPECATVARMKKYVHARLGEKDRRVLDRLKRSTGRTESELLRRGLHLVAAAEDRRHSALDLAGRSAGRFKNGPLDLSTSWEHLEGFGR
jgi:hypothetical protein